MKINHLIPDIKDLVILAIITTCGYGIYTYFNPKVTNESQRLLQTNTCTDCNLSAGERPNLSNKNLKNVNLAGSHLNYLRFTNSDLRNANFSNTTLKYANFFNADLTKADLSGADIRGANFSDAKLTNVNWTNARFNRFTEGIDPNALTKAGAIQE